MTLFRTVGPLIEPVTLAEAKAHLRLEQASEDPLIEGLIRAAREEVEKTTGQALIEQSWRLTLDDWPTSDVLFLNRTPVREVLSVTVFDTDGAASVVDPSTYLLPSPPDVLVPPWKVTPLPKREDLPVLEPIRNRGVQNFHNILGSQLANSDQLFRKAP